MKKLKTMLPPITKAYWRAEMRAVAEWQSEMPAPTHQQIKDRERGYAGGWLDGAAWARREARRKQKEGAKP